VYTEGKKFIGTDNETNSLKGPSHLHPYVLPQFYHNIEYLSQKMCVKPNEFRVFSFNIRVSGYLPIIELKGMET